MDRNFDLKFVISEKSPREYETGNPPLSFESPANSLTPVPGQDNPWKTGEKEYYPVGVLAKEFDYAVDYISWLARTGKVEAIRKGKRWVVTRESVQAHKDAAQNNKQQGGWKSSKVLSLGIVPSQSSDSKSTYQKADKVRAALSFTLAGGLLLFLFFNFGIIKVNFDFNTKPVASIWSSFANWILPE